MWERQRETRELEQNGRQREARRDETEQGPYESLRRVGGPCPAQALLPPPVARLQALSLQLVCRQGLVPTLGQHKVLTFPPNAGTVARPRGGGAALPTSQRVSLHVFLAHCAGATLGSEPGGPCGRQSPRARCSPDCRLFFLRRLLLGPQPARPQPLLTLGSEYSPVSSSLYSSNVTSQLPAHNPASWGCRGDPGVIYHNTAGHSACRECPVNGCWSFLLQQDFCEEAEGSAPPQVQPELTQQRRGKQAGIIARQLHSAPPALRPQAGRGSPGSCRTAPPACTSTGPLPTPHLPITPHGCALPEDPGRAAASPHTQGSHMLARHPACRPVCCRGTLPTPWQGEAGARPGRWWRSGGRRGVRAPAERQGRVGAEPWAGGSLAGRQEMPSWPCLWGGRHCRPGRASPGRGATHPQR